MIGHFDLLPIAYRTRDPQKGYFALDVARGDVIPTTDFDYLGARYAQNALQVSGRPLRKGLFAQALTAVRGKAGSGELTLSLLCPPKFMAYLNWKSLKTCTSMGVASKDVAACHGRLVRSGTGWVLSMELITLRDGRRLRVGRGT